MELKTKGVWGEAHLDNLLSEVLNADQYQKDFKPNPDKADKVEFALKIPSSQDNQQMVYLPIDAKLPLTDFENLQEALADSQATTINKARQRLYRSVKDQAKKIATKYINPPITTGFVIMYLPLESLYAEISQNSQLIAELRQNHNVTLAGPSTILPMLGLLNMGYRSLAMQKQASQIWSLLLETQTEIVKFAGLIDKARLKLNEAGSVIDDAGNKTHKIERKFQKIQTLKVDQKLLKEV